MSVNLDPCPFCGEAPAASGEPPFCDVKCVNNDCFIQPELDTFAPSHIDAAIQWNMRKESL